MDYNGDWKHMVDDDDLNERFREFYTIFFYPSRSRHRFVIDGIRFPNLSDSPFTEAASEYRLLREEMASNAECASLRLLDEDECDISEGMRSPELSTPLPVSYEDVMRWPAETNSEISGSVDVRRQSSAYSSQDQSLSTSGQNENEGGAVLLHSGFTTPDSVDVGYENTVVLAVTSLHVSSLRVDQPTAEQSDNSNTIPLEVSGLRLTDDNEFESVRFQDAGESFGTEADGFGHEQTPPRINWQPAQQPITYQDLRVVITALENRIIQGLLIALLQEGCSPENVYSVAEAMFLSAYEAPSSGTVCLLPTIFNSSNY